MKLFKNTVFRDVRSLKDITKPEYRYALLFLFWALDFPMFFIIEVFIDNATVIRCALDDQIPFIGEFILVYIYWLPFYMGTIIYMMLYDPPVFIRGMCTFILIFTITKLIFIFFPSTIDMRPDPVPGSPAIAGLVRFIYAHDSGENCFPSEHVLAAVIVLFMAFDSKRTSKPWVRIYFTVSTLLITLSVMFVKQHSILDVIAAVPLLAAGWLLFFLKRPGKPRPGDNYELPRGAEDMVITKAEDTNG